MFNPLMITTMKNKVFTTEFYQKMYSHLIEEVNNGFYDEQLQGGKFIGMDYEAEDGTYLTFEVKFETEVNSHVAALDPSDEWCTLDAIDIVDLKDIKAYESGLTGSEELTGFDYDAFFAATENI